MKTFIITICLLLSSYSINAQEKYESGATIQILKQKDDPRLVGTIWISHNGKLNIVWKGVSLQAGKIVLPLNEYGQAFTKFPSINFDLQEIFGAKWMESLELNINTAVYDKDPIRSTTDISIGTISLSLTQKVPMGEGWSWTVTESIGGTLSFKRVFHETGKIFEGNPINLSLNTKIVRKFSTDLAISVAMGAFISVPRPQDGDKSGLLKGAYIDTTAQLNDRFRVGLKVDGAQLVIPQVDSRGFKFINATVYANYVLKKSKRFTHYLQAEFSKTRDGIITHANGSPRRTKKFSINYSLGW